MVRIATETEEKHRSFADNHEQLRKQKLYFRFNPPYLDEIGLDQPAKRSDIRVRTEAYGNDSDVIDRVRQFHEVAGSEPSVSSQEREQWQEFA